MASLQIDVSHRNQALAHHVHGGLRLLRDYVAKQGGADDRGERLLCLGSISPSRALRHSALAISDAIRRGAGKSSPPAANRCAASEPFSAISHLTATLASTTSSPW